MREPILNNRHISFILSQGINATFSLLSGGYNTIGICANSPAVTYMAFKQESVKIEMVMRNDAQVISRDLILNNRGGVTSNKTPT